MQIITQLVSTWAVPRLRRFELHDMRVQVGTIVAQMKSPSRSNAKLVGGLLAATPSQICVRIA